MSDIEENAPAADESNATPPVSQLEPEFTKGTLIGGPSLVIDQAGHAWWVNPHLQELRRAKAG